MEFTVQIDINQLKKDIEHHQNLRSRFIKESNHMLFFIAISLICIIYGLFASKFIFAFCLFIFAFLCVRRYNVCIDKAEVHTGIMKFLKALLIEEQTGEEVFKNIVT